MAGRCESGSDHVGLFVTLRHALADVQRRRADLKSNGPSRSRSAQTKVRKPYQTDASKAVISQRCL
jgi:hypothetical protein